MDSSSKIENLHIRILSPNTQKAFWECTKMDFFSKGGWYLAGGTALSLQTGHRQSFDLDFFTPQKSFKEKKVEEVMSLSGLWETSSLDRGTLYGQISGAKISLIAYPFFKPSKSFLKVDNVSIMLPEDIAAMKIMAISQRGRKRDFFDLYWLSKNVQPLLKSIEMQQEQYSIKQHLSHILKSLVYFEDAELDPDPKIYFKATWKEVKNFFKKEVLAVSKNLLQ